MVHCERCGNPVEVDSGSYDYCVCCGLYVCMTCWDGVGSCMTCRAAAGRRTFAKDVGLMRRIDRRLREVGREAAALTARAVGQPEPGDVLSTDLACLRIKAGAATRARDQLLAKRRRGKQKSTPPALNARVDLHSAESEWLLLRASGALLPSDEDPLSLLTARRRAAERGVWGSRTWIPVAGAAAGLALMAVVLALAQADGIRDGILAGAPESSPASAGSPALSSPGAESPTFSVAPSPSPVLHVFDDQRIGAPDGWQETAEGGSVGVVALPTSFNRSLEVRTADGTPVGSCLAVDPTVPFGAFELDVLVGASDDPVARVTLGSVDSGQLLEVEVGVKGTSVHASDGSSIRAAGVAPEEWHRLRLLAHEDGYQVALEVAEGTGEHADPVLFATESLGSLSRVCLEVVGPSGSTARYDNLTLHSHAPSEG